MCDDRLFVFIFDRWNNKNGLVPLYYIVLFIYIMACTEDYINFVCTQLEGVGQVRAALRAESAERRVGEAGERSEDVLHFAVGAAGRMVSAGSE